MTYYIREQVVDLVFEYVSDRYGRAEEVPRYRQEVGFAKFCSVLRQAQADVYYPTLLDKAVYLLIGINKGHFFSNGNKRLALVVTTLFLVINDLTFRNEDKDWYQVLLHRLFPEYTTWEDFEEFTPTDFATYNLSIMVAESSVYNINHDTLKRRVLDFLESATIPA